MLDHLEEIEQKMAAVYELIGRVKVSISNNNSPSKPKSPIMDASCIASPEHSAMSSHSQSPIMGTGPFIVYELYNS